MDPVQLRPVFQEVDGHVIPNLTAEPDGKEFFTSADIAARNGRGAAYWDDLFYRTYRKAAQSRQDAAEVLRKERPAPVDEAGASMAAAVEAAERALLRQFVYPHLSDEDFELYVTYCRKYRLDPFSRHLIPMRRFDADKGREVFEVFLTIDALIAIAEETGLYEGPGTTQWCGADGVWVNVWTRPEAPVAARTPVFKKGYREPVAIPAYLAFYKPVRMEDLGGDPISPDYWVRDEGRHMLGKCSLSLSLHRAFASAYGPLKSMDEYSGLIARTTRQTDPDRRGGGGGGASRGGAEGFDAPVDAADSQAFPDDGEPSFDASTGGPIVEPTPPTKPSRPTSSPTPARSKANTRDVISAANGAGDRERRLEQERAAAGRPTAKRDWGPYPCSHKSFEMALHELGFKTESMRDGIRQLFRKRSPRLLEKNAEQFYRDVLDELRRNPAEYGAVLPMDDPSQAA